MTRRALILSVVGVVILGAVLVLRQGGARAPVPAAPFVAWAKKHAVAIKTVEPGSGFADLQPLKPIIGRARVVGVGEATHGTREFFQFKHRLLEFLVEEMGFTAFAMETGFARATKINAYVQGGSGDAARLVAELQYWMWNTEEVVALVEWMREYNLRPTTAHKVSFYGFDMQNPGPPLREALAYLKAVDPEQARQFEAFRSQVADFQVGKTITAAQFADAKATLDRLRQTLESNRARFVAAGGDRPWRFAQQNTNVARQGILLVENYQDAVRDAAMTENVQWILHEEGPAGRVMLWAHNAHIQHPPEHWFGWLPANIARGYTPMGTHLKKIFGPDYAAVGLAFNQGGFRSMALKTLTVGPADGESLDGALARIGLPILALDLRVPVDDVGATKWLTTGHSARSVALYGGGDDEESLVASDCYEAIVFFDRTTASRVLPRVK